MRAQASRSRNRRNVVGFVWCSPIVFVSDLFRFLADFLFLFFFPFFLSPPLNSPTSPSRHAETERTRSDDGDLKPRAPSMLDPRAGGCRCCDLP